MKCPCLRSSKSVEFKKSSLTYRPSNSIIESRHPTTPTRRSHKSQPNKGHTYLMSTAAPGQPYYTGAIRLYGLPHLPHSHKRHSHDHPPKGHPKHNNNPSGESESEPTPTEGDSLPEVTISTTVPTAFTHVSERTKYHKNIGEETAGQGLTRTERRLLGQFGDGKLVSRFETAGGKFVKKKPPTPPPAPPPPPKRHWNFPMLVWKAKQKFLKNRKKKGNLDKGHEVLDKLIDEGQKWHAKKNRNRKKRSKDTNTKPKYVKTKVDGKPAWVSFGEESLPTENLVGHSNYTGPETIPRMRKGYCIIEPCESPECNNAGTQIRTYAHGYQCATHKLQTVGGFSSESLGCNDMRTDGYGCAQSQWPNYTECCDNPGDDEDRSQCEEE